jgi:hypothetical protein
MDFPRYLLVDRHSVVSLSPEIPRGCFLEIHQKISKSQPASAVRPVLFVQGSIDAARFRPAHIGPVDKCGNILAWIIHDFAGGKRKGALKDG